MHLMDTIKGMEFTDISGSLTLDRSGARIDNLRWNTREGSHEISGMLGFNAQPSLNMKVKSQNIWAEQVLLLAGMSYPITGYVNNNMTITGTLKNPVRYRGNSGLEWLGYGSAVSEHWCRLFL